MSSQTALFHGFDPAPERPCDPARHFSTRLKGPIKTGWLRARLFARRQGGSRTTAADRSAVKRSPRVCGRDAVSIALRRQWMYPNSHPNKCVPALPTASRCVSHTKSREADDHRNWCSTRHIGTRRDSPDLPDSAEVVSSILTSPTNVSLITGVFLLPVDVTTMSSGREEATSASTSVTLRSLWGSE
jgi:hypothetical protein